MAILPAGVLPGINETLHVVEDILDADSPIIFLGMAKTRVRRTDAHNVIHNIKYVRADAVFPNYQVRRADRPRERKRTLGRAGPKKSDGE